VRIALLTRGDLFPTNHGAAVKIVRTAEALVAGGDEVWVLTEDRDHYWSVVPGAWERVAYGPRVRAAIEWPVLRNQARAERLCAAIGYPRDEWFLYRPLTDPGWWARALHVGRRHGVDSFQAEFPGYALPALVAGRLLGRRVVLGTHNVEYDRLGQMAGLPSGPLARIARVERALARLVDDVVVCSEADRRRYADAGVPTAHMHYIPHGVDLERYPARRVDLRVRYGLPAGPVLFFHGTLHYAPNTDAVRFLAESLVPRLPPRATLLVAGLTPPRELESEQLRFTGPVEDLPGHIEAADVCLCPVEKGGGTRMKLLEYFAAGKPVVATPTGAEGLEVRDGVELRQVPLEQFVDTTLSLLEAPDERRRLGRAAREWVRSRGWAGVAEAWRDVHGGRGHDWAPSPAPDAYLPAGRRPSKPLTLLFLVNRGCNLRCRFCDLWEGKIHVPLERALALFEEAVRIGTRTVVLTGGEPLLHPELPAMVRGAKALGLSVNVTTNGTLLDRHWEALADAGVDSLSFSVDGLPDTHDRLRGKQGSHAATWAALERTVRSGRMDPSVYFVVTRENVGELVEVWRRVRALGARFDFWPVNDAPELYLRTAEEKEAWLEAVRTIGASDPEVAARAHYYAEGLGYHAGERGPVRCLGLVDQYGVTYDGDLLPCCVWGGDGLKVGNVFETPLSTLWRSPEVQSRRHQLYQEGCTAGCYNHSLYEFGVSTGLSHKVGNRTRTG